MQSKRNFINWLFAINKKNRFRSFLLQSIIGLFNLILFVEFIAIIIIFGNNFSIYKNYTNILFYSIVSFILVIIIINLFISIYYYWKLDFFNYKKANSKLDVSKPTNSKSHFIMNKNNKIKIFLLQTLMGVFNLIFFIVLLAIIMVSENSFSSNANISFYILALFILVTIEFRLFISIYSYSKVYSFNKQKTNFHESFPKNIVVEIKDLELGFRNPANPNEFNMVIRKTSFKIYAGEILSIIGESGSGKSVISSTLYGLSGSASEIIGGTIKIFGQNVEKFTEKKWQTSGIRGKIVSAVFQNPMTTLNPTIKVGKQIVESLLINKIVKSKKAAKKIAMDYLTKTRINNPEKVMHQYPNSLSGGMRQRVVISAIMACRPKLIVFDEPTTALDPTAQAEILEIIKEFISETKSSAIFITHDLGVVASIADRIAIMYAGQIVEKGLTAEILYNPKHPYTWGLLTSMPDINYGKRLRTIPGAVPANLNNIKHDVFAERNKFSLGIDFEIEPPFFKLSKTHYAKTWLLDKRAPKVDVPDEILKRWKEFKTFNFSNKGEKNVK